MAILLIINKSTSSSVISKDQFKDRFSTNTTSLFNKNKESNYDFSASANKTDVDSKVENNVKNNFDVNRVHSNQLNSTLHNAQHSNNQYDNMPEHHRNHSKNHRVEHRVDQQIDNKYETEKWSDWSSCSVDCGIGLQTQRLQTNGEFSSIKYKICKKQVK